MADRDPRLPQSDDETLLADLIRTLRIIGPLGRLNIADIVIPTVSLGDVRTTGLQPVFTGQHIFSNGVKTAAPAFTRHADTRALPAGDYDVQLIISPHTTEAHVWQIQITGGIPVLWNYIVPIDGPGLFQTLGLNMTEGGSLFIQNQTVFGPGVQSVATIFARIRT